MYKAIFVDVDGTLVLKKNALPTERVRNAIKEVSKKIHFGLATSRPYSQLQVILDYLGLTGPSIICGGAQIIDAGTRRYLVEYAISIKITYTVCSLLMTKFRKKMKKLWVQDNGIDREFTENYIAYKPFVIVASGLSTDAADEVIHILSLIPDIFATKVISDEKSLIDVEVTDINATKQHGITTAARLLGIKKEEIIGIGDGYNDFPLFMACGLKIAMGNAVRELKSLADYVAPAVEDNGVAIAIEKYFSVK